MVWRQGGKCFSICHNSRTQGGHPVKQIGSRLRTNKRKYYFTQCIINLWNSLQSDEVLGTHSLRQMATLSTEHSPPAGHCLPNSVVVSFPRRQEKVGGFFWPQQAGVHGWRAGTGAGFIYCRSSPLGLLASSFRVDIMKILLVNKMLELCVCVCVVAKNKNWKKTTEYIYIYIFTAHSTPYC